MKLRDEASALLGTRIVNWSHDIERISLIGSFDNKKLKQLVILLCQKIEELEKEAHNHKQDSMI